jgi:hypothetical protein|tara:strand:+ start:6618 stop:11699 length:5082 start_codon:yes stop_codon:yes gene_type:complete
MAFIRTISHAMKKLTRMQSTIFTFLLSIIGAVTNYAQIVVGQDTLVGNEWINYDHSYYKMMLAEDGLYRVSYDELQAAGVPVQFLVGAELQVYYFGQEQAISVSNSGSLSSGGYIEFVGVKNRGELDKHLYVEQEDPLNPMYSLFSDTSAYFLTWDQGVQNKRFQEVIVDLNNNTLDAEQFYMHEDVVIFNNRLNKPSETQDVRFSQFLPGEGFCGDLQSINLFDHKVDNKYENGPAPSLDIRISGNNLLHTVDVSVNDNVKLTADFEQKQTKQYNIPLEENDFGNGDVAIKVRSYQSLADKNTIANSVLRYAREFDFENKNESQISLESSNQTRYFEFKNFDTNGEISVIDITNGIRYIPVIEDGLIKLLIPASSELITLKIISDLGIKNLSQIEIASMVDYAQMGEVEFVMYTSNQFDKINNDGVNYLRAYADHRASANGGSLTPAIVFVEDLYNQFGYGVHRHPLSIKNHARWVEDNWKEAKFNFVLGKGIEYASSRTEEQLNDPDPLKLNFFVPTFGVPGSDNTLFAKKNESQPRVPTGRISVTSINDIKGYYEKIITREDPTTYPSTIGGRLWTKNIIHLAGGDPNILDLIESSLDNMGNILVQSKFGANVTTFTKQSSSDIGTGFATQVLNKVDEGASIMSFFGHSAPGTLDFALEKAAQYNNEGKLPIFLSMGCYSGNIHTNAKAISEDFVLEPKVGSIVFMASSGSAYISPQGDLGEKFYQAVSSDEFYGGTVGEIVNHLLSANNTSSNISFRTLNEQFTLHGDPAVRITTFESPDYTIDFGSLTTTPSIISPENKEFELIYKVVNLGESINDSLNVRAIQSLPDGTAYDTLYRRIAGPAHTYIDTFTLTNPGLIGIGENCVSIELNYDQEVSEKPLPEATSNNVLGFAEGESSYCYFALDNSANPIYPEEFAIFNGGQPKLIASTSNILAGDKTYIIEMDTTSMFNSSIKETTVITDGGGSLIWQPESEFKPGEVYYWRVSADSTDVNIGFQWRESSFIYLPNSSDGWNQSHYYQFLKNNLTGIDYEYRKLDFINQGISIFTNLHIPQFDDIGGEILWPRMYENTFPVGQMRTWDYKNQGVPDGIAIAYRDNGINVFVKNESTGGGMGRYGSVFKNNTKRIYFFPTNSQQSRIDAVNMLSDSIPDGYHVFIYTVTNTIESDLEVEKWALDSLVNNGKNLFNVLEAQGSTLARKIEDLGTVPFGMIYTKNELFRDENIGKDRFSIVNIASDFERNYIEGDLNTPNIGPALSWDRMIWSVEDQSANDTYMLYIKGIKDNGEMDTLFTIVNEMEVDLSSIDAIEYPYLRLDMYTMDDVDRTPVNLKFWRVFYDAAPEAILNKDDTFVFNSDTLQQGQFMEFAIKAENISSNDMDSLLVKYTITNETNETIIVYDRLEPLKSNETQLLDFNYNTKALQGDQQFNFEINPEGDQPEKFVFNNFGVTDFYVRTDRKEPVLDVSFDGVHIINGDIVAANPFILIDVRDENEFLLLDDPEKIMVSLIDPNGNEVEYNIASPELSFEAATDLNNNQAKISLEPLLSQDGDYTLVVQAADASGNISGDNAYEVTFRVILRESVSNVLNYPNPFSSQTQFIFTLTGSEVPDDISISILTVSGKVVKEISREELGPLRIGLNRTDYKWNGTDDYGEKLANGVYLYKVNLPADMERYENQYADRFFTKGFGKLVIMR